MDTFGNFWKNLHITKARKMGIDAAGPVPNSLLARQDLESDEGIGKSYTVGYEHNSGKNVDLKTFETLKEAEEFKRQLKGEKRQWAYITEKATKSISKSFRDTWKNQTVIKKQYECRLCGWMGAGADRKEHLQTVHPNSAQSMYQEYFV